MKTGVSLETVGPIVVHDGPISIPYRIHLPQLERAQLAGLGSAQALMVKCLYSRHHDGRIRQAALQSIVRADQDWTAPFIVQLASEYVVEIRSRGQN
jgi:hypothetical protein